MTLRRAEAGRSASARSSPRPPFSLRSQPHSRRRRDGRFRNNQGREAVIGQINGSKQRQAQQTRRDHLADRFTNTSTRATAFLTNDAKKTFDHVKHHPAVRYRVKA